MMRIMLFNQSDNLFQKGIGQYESGCIVAPSPQVADIIRRRLPAKAQAWEVATISKFLRDELNQLKGEEVSENFRGKSELLLLLSTVWKKVGNGGSYELFQRCFRLLTDLRSFTMNDDVLASALEHYDEAIALGVMRMHQVLNQLDIYDEHRSYFQLSEKLREGDLPPLYQTERNLVFWGFDFLSGSQVDLLKAYAIRDNVMVPAYEKVYESLSDWDWLRWLEGPDVAVDKLDEARPAKRVEVNFFPKNYLAKAIKTKLVSNPGVPCQIILGERDSSYEKIQQALLLPSQFKSSVDILGDKISWLLERVSAGETATSELIELLRQLGSELIGKQDFRGLKAAQLLLSIVEQWRELSDENEVVAPFDFNIFKEALALDSPRVFQTALGPEEFSAEIKGLKELEDLNREKMKIFCVSSDLSSPKSSLVQYTEGLENYLSSIGPLRRAEIEFISLKEKLADALDRNSLFLVEQGALERDLGWKSFFEDIQTEEAPMTLDFGKRVAYFYPPAPPVSETNFACSATRLQTFLDCPRKYYFKYILKLAPNYVFNDKLDSMEMGRVQHALIEKYVEGFLHYVPAEHEALAAKLLAEATKSKQLSRRLLTEYQLEVVVSTRKAIQELLSLKARPDTKIRFEQRIADPGFQGSIDCVIETENDILLLDFKRGKGAIPNKTGFLVYEKIQLWFYANHWNRRNKNLALGYVCLSEMDASVLFYSADATAESFRGVFEAKPIDLSKDFEEVFARYQDYEQKALERLKAAEDFPAAPAKPKVCSFCDLSKICPRDGKGASHVDS